jgi:chemotaxis protein methyltransferase CheR
MVICRNVLIYFNNELKDNVLDLLQRSLLPGGVLGIGSKESIRFSKIRGKFDVLSEKAKIYQKKVEFD